MPNKRVQKNQNVELALTGTQYRASWWFRFRISLQPNGTNSDTKQVLDSIFCPAMPAHITNIEARYTVAALSAACNASPDPESRALPVEGYIQHSKGISQFDLDRWVPNTEWTHAGGRLTENADYKKYNDSKADTSVYIHKKFTERQPLAKEGAASQKRAR